MLPELAAFSEDVRPDVIEVLRAALTAAQKGWTRFRGVPLRWVVFDGSATRVQRPTYDDLAVDWERLRGESSFWSSVHAKARTCRCVALVYGNALPSRTWGPLGVLVGLAYRELPILDGDVRVLVRHENGEQAPFRFPVAYRRTPLRRLVYADDVRSLLREAN